MCVCVFVMFRYVALVCVWASYLLCALSLGGNCMTSMIATLSIERNNIEVRERERGGREGE